MYNITNNYINFMNNIFFFCFFYYSLYLSKIVCFKIYNTFYFFIFNKKETQKLEDKKTNVLSKKEILYEDKYKEKFEKKEEKKLNQEDLQNLKNNHIIEYTPLGNVLMFYKYDKNDTDDLSSFIFYSDHTIPYRYLETVARKYCITYNCKIVYVDIEKQLKELKENEKQIKIEEELNKNEKQIKIEEEELLKKKQDNCENNNSFQNSKSVFAKFKTYNKNTEITNANVISHVSNKNNQNMNKSINYIQTNKTNQFVKENANRFTYLGKFVNFSFIKTEKERKIEKNISYKDYKKITK